MEDCWPSTRSTRRLRSAPYERAALVRGLHLSTEYAYVEFSRARTLPSEGLMGLGMGRLGGLGKSKPRFSCST